jgi:hypothetical protein
MRLGVSILLIAALTLPGCSLTMTRRPIDSKELFVITNMDRLTLLGCGTVVIVRSDASVIVRVVPLFGPEYFDFAEHFAGIAIGDKIALYEWSDPESPARRRITVPAAYVPRCNKLKTV